jgi:hypothetical protein
MPVAREVEAARTVAFVFELTFVATPATDAPKEVEARFVLALTAAVPAVIAEAREVEAERIEALVLAFTPDETPAIEDPREEDAELVLLLIVVTAPETCELVLAFTLVAIPEIFVPRDVEAARTVESV